MFLKKSAGMVLARGTAYKPGYVGGMLSASRSFAGPSVIYLSSLPPGIGRAARWSRSSLPVYLTLQPARCAACHIAVASGGLLPRLFTLAVGLRWAAWAVVFCHITLPLPTAPRRECGALCCPDFPLAPHSCAIPPYVKAAREPISYAGINSIGLRRRNFSNDTIRDIQEIYRYLYLSGLNVSDAVERIEAELPATKERDEIILFVRNAKRGIIRGYV